MNRAKKILRKTICLIAWGLIICGILFLFHIYSGYKNAQREYVDLQQKYTAVQKNIDDEEKPEKIQTKNKEANVVPTPELPEDAPQMRTIGFAGLSDINEDVIGWIDLPALELSYPIMQGTDNDYYLHRNINKEESFAGSIFMDSANSPSFQNFNTIIYGHNMRDGSMFAQLKEYQNQKTYTVCPYFWIYTPDAAFLYRIFSVRTVRVTDDVFTVIFPDQNTYADWLKTMQEASELTEKPRLQTGDRVVTLSTCTGNDTSRQIVQGVRVWMGENNAEYRENIRK